MENEGWIKLHRKIKKWEWYKDQNTKDVFIHLMLNANYEESKYMGYTIERGQMVFGRKKCSEDTGISIQSVRTSINRLKSTGEITIKTTNKFSIITICNFDEYQPTTEEINQQTNQDANHHLTINQPSTNHILRNKEIKKERNNTIGALFFECPDHLKDLWPDYLITRKNKKAAKTESALLRIINKLEKLAPENHEKQHEILQISVDSGWTDVYPLKDNTKSQQKFEFEKKAQGKYGNY